MAEYQVVLKDSDGYEISADTVEAFNAAKERAKYLLTDAYARQIGTTHEALGTHKVEVQKLLLERGSVVFWDSFYMPWRG